MFVCDSAINSCISKQDLITFQNILKVLYFI